MEFLKIVFGIVVGLFLIDRVGLWLESKGWLYWRKKKSKGGGLGNALQEFNALMDPRARHVIVIEQKDSRQREDQGDGKRSKPPAKLDG